MKEYNVPVQSLIDHIKTATDVDPWAKEMVEELLKEQEAELSYRNAKTITHTATKLDDATCPSCGNVVRVRYNYCHYCGQKLDWEGRLSE